MFHVFAASLHCSRFCQAKLAPTVQQLAVSPTDANVQAVDCLERAKSQENLSGRASNCQAFGRLSFSRSEAEAAPGEHSSRPAKPPRRGPPKSKKPKAKADFFCHRRDIHGKNIVKTDLTDRCVAGKEHCQTESSKEKLEKESRQCRFCQERLLCCWPWQSFAPVRLGQAFQIQTVGIALPD